MAIALTRAFDSLKVRNYRLFFAGQMVSWTGTWVQWIAQGWLVLEITGSGVGLGLVTALQWLPVLVLGAWAGVVADRFDKRRILLFTNVAGAVLSVALGIVTMTGVVNIPIVLIVAGLLGAVTAIDNPARQSFTMEMVGRDLLTNAVSLNTATFTTARVLGPVVAGLLIDNVGIGLCFLLNAVSFVPVTLALLVMNTDELRTGARAERAKGQVREALRYVAADRVLRTLLIVMAVVGTLQYNFQIILPLLAKETFGGDASTLGLLGAAVGVGMLAGSLGSAMIDGNRRGVLLVSALALGGLSLGVASAPSLLFALMLLVPLGAASMVFLATINSSLQLASSDQMRGRVMALYFVLFLGSTPIGAPIVGWVAEVFDPRASLALGGVATLLAVAYARPRLSVLGAKRDDVVRDEAVPASA